jgi:class 3 adenylate cyclase
LQAGEDKAAIDRRIWDLFGEEWCIMATDLVGFSRGVADFGIVHFLQTITESERLLVPIVEDHDGIFLKMEGDSFLFIFRVVEKALRAAIRIQQVLREYNTERPAVEQVLAGVGLGFGRVLRIGDADVFGEEVNAAYILGEDLSKAYEILVTQGVRDAYAAAGDLSFEEIDDVPPGSRAAYRVSY